VTMARGDRVNWRTGTTTTTPPNRGHHSQRSLLLGSLVVVILTVGGGVASEAAVMDSGEEELVLADFRRVPYESLLHSMDQFTETGISHFSEILFDVKRYQLIVGARDALFR
jgi:hypothetical protein